MKSEVLVLFGFTAIFNFGWLLLAQAEPAATEVPDKSPGPGKAAGEPNDWWMIFANPLNLMILALALFWLIVILPQQRAMRAEKLAMQKMLDELKKNDRVVTAAGIHGVVVSTSPETGTVTLRIDESTNARMTINRNTIVQVGEATKKA